MFDKLPHLSSASTKVTDHFYYNPDFYRILLDACRKQNLANSPGDFYQTKRIASLATILLGLGYSIKCWLALSCNAISFHVMEKFSFSYTTTTTNVWHLSPALWLLSLIKSVVGKLKLGLATIPHTFCQCPLLGRRKQQKKGYSLSYVLEYLEEADCVVCSAA